MLTPEILEQRLSGIGGSDSSAIAGLSQYSTAVDVYLEKTRQVAPPDLSDKQAVHFGNVLESVVAAEYSRRRGVKVHRRNKLLRHPDMPYMLANVDRLVVGKKKGLEIKTANEYLKGSWGPSGTDQVPDAYLCQCVHYMVVTGRKVWDLAVLIGGQEYRDYTIGFDQSLADRLVEIETDFWVNHVERLVPPAPVTHGDIASLYPVAGETEVLADDDVISALQARAAAKAMAKQAENEISVADLTIKKAMGEAGVLKGDDGAILATFRNRAAYKTPDKAAMVTAGIFDDYCKTAGGGRALTIKPGV